MLAEKIGNVSKALGALAHKVDEETWAVLRMAKNELMDCYDIAKSLEGCVLKIKKGEDNGKKEA